MERIKKLHKSFNKSLKKSVILYKIFKFILFYIKFLKKMFYIYN